MKLDRRLVVTHGWWAEGELWRSSKQKALGWCISSVSWLWRWVMRIYTWWVWWRRDRLPTPVFLGFPGGSEGKESAHNAGDLSSIPGLGRSPGEVKGYPLQYSGLENSMDYTVHEVAKSDMTEWISVSHVMELHRTTYTHKCMCVKLETTE